MAGMLAQQGSGLGLGHLAADQPVAENLQVALDGAHAGLEQEPSRGIVQGQLTVLLEQRHQLTEEWLEALRADVAGRLPGNPKALLKVEGAAPSAPHRHPLAPTQHGDGVLAAVAGGQAEGVENSTWLRPAGSPIFLLLLARELIPILDPHCTDLQLPARGRTTAGTNLS
jgi:hypothetical protein